MKAALLITSARRLARPALGRSVAMATTNALASSASSSMGVSSLLVTRQATPMTLLSTRAFSSTKKPKASGDGSDSDSDSDSEAGEDAEDDGEEDAADDEDDEEEEEDEAELRAAARAAFTKEDLDKFNDDDWDEERWGKLDSEDWQGFEGDLDAVTSEGVPTWLQSVRDLSAIHSEKRMRAKLLRRAMEEAKMNVPRFRKVDELGRAYGTGRRKTSTARVWIKKSATPFSGTIKINKKDLTEYFVRDTYREDVLKPFMVLGEVGNFDVYATVAGGGLTGQAGAVRHGISRALQLFDPAWRPPLKKEKLLMRDPRGVERKKAGQKKARKKFQWVKR